MLVGPASDLLSSCEEKNTGNKQSVLQFRLPSLKDVFMI